MARSRGRPDPQALRARVAAEAARLLAQHGGGDVAAARRKAAQRLGARDERDLPGAPEIEAALAEHRRPFGGAAGAERVQELRAAALEAMGFLAAFEPRLSGPVLDGTPGPGDAVLLFLHADDGGDVLRALDTLGVRYDEGGRRLPLADGSTVEATVLEFEAGGVPFDVVVLPLHALRQPPLSPLERTPLPRASAADLRRLLAAGP
ncbi:MAG: hypothetical protein LW860_01145 [Xanthomonadaceae bacterium]|jgi:hypothetical protein|nr:hypothetical protein [Xanthomonadaceae bacterium]